MTRAHRGVGRPGRAADGSLSGLGADGPRPAQRTAASGVSPTRRHAPGDCPVGPPAAQAHSRDDPRAGITAIIPLRPVSERCPRAALRAGNGGPGGGRSRSDARSACRMADRFLAKKLRRFTLPRPALRGWRRALPRPGPLSTPAGRRLKPLASQPSEMAGPGRASLVKPSVSVRTAPVSQAPASLVQGQRALRKLASPLPRRGKGF